MTRTRQHLILFVKEPRLGRVKRRLAADIGAPAALRFYERTLRTVLRELSAGPWRTVLAVTPDNATASISGWSRRIGAPVRIIGQGAGDIGTRMRRAIAAMPAGPAVLIGGDIPEVRAQHIRAAFSALGTSDCVFGPACDGGYWLVGLRRSPASPDVFANVRWSSPHTLADSLARVPRGRRHALVDELEDVDDGAAYDRWLARQGKI